MARKIIILVWLVALALAPFRLAKAQQSKIYRIGVILPGGPSYEAVSGLRDGLKELGLEEGKQFTLAIKNTQADPKVAEEAARNCEREKVNLIYALPSSVIAAAKAATTNTPIVFGVGSDPVAMGLVDSFAKPGGRLTGVHFLVGDLTAKRLEILKEAVPKLRRAVTFYDPRRPTAIESSKLAREAAQQMGLQLVERHVASIEELQTGVRALRAGEVDAYLAVSDAIASNQAQLIIDTARVKKFATMLDFLSHVIKGGLASYAVSFHEMGRLSAKYVQRILTGVKPQDLPVEGIDRIELVINLKTAKDIGLTIPPNVLARADRVIR